MKLFQNCNPSFANKLNYLPNAKNKKKLIGKT